MGKNESDMQKAICFFIGTEAELIKVFTVIKLMKERGIPYCVIASGQNDIEKSHVLFYANEGKIDLCLSQESSIRKNTLGLFKWFFHTLHSSAAKIRKGLPTVDFKNSVMVVHGDTVSTVMGAYLGRKLGMKVAHIEAGLRSHNLLHPFPEEIDRIITSHFSYFHFAPGDLPAQNLTSKKGKIINTRYNTIIDSIAAACDAPCENPFFQKLKDQAFFVLVLHRQENLSNRKLVQQVVEQAEEIATKCHCVFVMHKITELTLKKYSFYKRLAQNPAFTLLPRADYFDFTKFLQYAIFVVTDGGSNQEELYYMGKPCLILRHCTEREEGLGKNAVLFDDAADSMQSFSIHYQDYAIAPTVCSTSPSTIIVDVLERYLEGEN